MPLDKRFIKGVRDSKMLSAAQRDRLAKQILRQAIRVGLGAASVREIDQINIYYATILAMRRAVARAGDHDYVIVDGRRIRGFEEYAGPYQSMIDGDARCYAVACASIVAKVTRDRLMKKLSDALPVVRLGAQRRLRHARSPRRHECPRRDRAPPTLVHHDAARPGRRAGAATALRRQLESTMPTLEIDLVPIGA